MTFEDLRRRTFRFAVRAVRFCRTLPDSWETRRIGGQLIDASTSVAMNYRATRRPVPGPSSSRRWVLSSKRRTKLDLARGTELEWLKGEAGELLAIFSKSQKTAKDNRRRAESAGSPNRSSMNTSSIVD